MSGAGPESLTNRLAASITFVVPVGSRRVYEKNFLSSPLFFGKSDFEIQAQQGFQTAGQAFNDGIEKASNDIVVCCHEDVVFPATWARQFVDRLAEIESGPAAVGVAGCVGITPEGRRAGHIYRHDREIPSECALPAKVETLDEMLLAIRKTSGLRFDPALPSFFYYAVDICLQASAQGLTNTAVDAPCFHQGKDRQNFLPRAFFESQHYVFEKWKHVLPVKTLSGRLDRKGHYWVQRLKHSVRDLIGCPTRPWWKDMPQIDPNAVLYEGGFGVKNPD